MGHLEHDADEGEDKIAKKARLEQLEPMEVAHYYTERYHRAMDALNVETPVDRTLCLRAYHRADRVRQEDPRRRLLPTSRTVRSISTWRSTMPNIITDVCRGVTSTTSSPTRASWTGRATSATPMTSPWKKASPEHIMAGLAVGRGVPRLAYGVLGDEYPLPGRTLSTSTEAAWI